MWALGLRPRDRRHKIPDVFAELWVVFPEPKIEGLLCRFRRRLRSVRGMNMNPQGLSPAKAAGKFFLGWEQTFRGALDPRYPSQGSESHLDLCAVLGLSSLSSHGSCK